MLFRSLGFSIAAVHLDPRSSLPPSAARDPDFLLAIGPEAPLVVTDAATAVIVVVGGLGGDPYFDAAVGPVAAGVIPTAGGAAGITPAARTVFATVAVVTALVAVVVTARFVVMVVIESVVDDGTEDDAAQQAAQDGRFFVAQG